MLTSSMRPLLLTRYDEYLYIVLLFEVRRRGRGEGREGERGGEGREGREEREKNSHEIIGYTLGDACSKRFS